MVITVNLVKKLTTGLLAVGALAMILMTSTAVTIRAEADDAGATYKAKCAMCHGAKAEKAFDPSKADGALVDAVLKGVKPKMPAYDGKMTADAAKGLVAYMKSIRK
jgi:mono/diheme cytochrome c family protein